MNERQQEAIGETESAERKSEWSRPEVDRLIAGGAEAAGDTTTDGVDTLS